MPDTLQRKARLFQHDLGGFVGGVYLRLDADEIKGGKGLPADLPHRRRHHAPAPERPSQPVAQLAVSAIHILPPGHRDAAHRLTADHNGPAQLVPALPLQAVPDKIIRVQPGIGAGEHIPEIGGNAGVIGIADQGDGVRLLPGPQTKRRHLPRLLMSPV